MLRTTEQRQVLLELELTSVSRARSFVPVVTTSRPDSAPPTGDDSPAAYWCARFDQARDEEDRTVLVALAWAELRRIRRRAFPAVAWDEAGELADRVLDDGEGEEATTVAIALRCTPTFVRRTRFANGRDPDHGRRLRLDRLDPASLRAAGLSIRQAAAVIGVPRSTLHGQLARA